MKKKVLAGLVAFAVALGGCQSPGAGVEPPADTVTDTAEAGENQAAPQDEQAGAAADGEEAESVETEATAEGAGAEGDGTEAAEGEGAEAAEDGTEAEGDGTEAAEVEGAEAAEDGTEAEGDGTEAAEGEGAEAAEDGTEAEGDGTEAAEGEGAGVSTEEGSGTDGSSAREKIPAVTPDISDAQDQIGVIAAAVEEWIHSFEEYESYRALGVTDLDENGRLEVVIGTSWSSGLHTRFDIWEVSEDRSALVHVENDFTEEDSEPDLLSSSAYDFYSDEEGHHYLAYDFEGSANRSEQTLYELTVKDGRLTHETLGTLETVYSLRKEADESEEDTEETGEMTTERFWAIASETLAGKADTRQVWITWMNLPASNDGNWDTAQVTARLWSAWLGYKVGSDVFTDMLAGAYEGDGDTVIASPGEGPAYAEAESDTQALALEMLSQTANEITDTDAWFERNGLEKPAGALTSDRWMVYVDKTARTAEVMKDGAYDCLLDFGELCRVEEDPGDIKIRFAALDGDVLYISVSRKGSSDLYYKTGFIAAIDLNEKALLWKSDSAVAGAFNFIVLDGRIFSGYGGTGEDDYLYQLDALTGRTLGSVRLATGPDYILARDGVLYVRCYDTDYTFSLSA